MWTREKTRVSVSCLDTVTTLVISRDCKLKNLNDIIGKHDIIYETGYTYCNAMQHCQTSTKPRPKATCTENLTKIERADFWDMYADRRTDRLIYKYSAPLLWVGWYWTVCLVYLSNTGDFDTFDWSRNLHAPYHSVFATLFFHVVEDICRKPSSQHNFYERQISRYETDSTNWTNPETSKVWQHNWTVLMCRRRTK